MHARRTQADGLCIHEDRVTSASDLGGIRASAWGRCETQEKPAPGGPLAASATAKLAPSLYVELGARVDRVDLARSEAAPYIGGRRQAGEDEPRGKRMGASSGYRFRVGFGLLVAGLVFVFVVATASAASRVYWTDAGTHGVSSANLDGSGAGSDLSTTGATAPAEASGTAIDIAAGKIYWVDQMNNTVSFANLDGSGGGDLKTTGATVDVPEGVAIDPDNGKVYWANDSLSAPISFANLNGSGGGDLNFTGATVDEPSGLAIDPDNGKVYWANFNNNTISFANLNGTGGGGQLNITGATAVSPAGVAIDAAAGKIYWTNFNNHTISFANLNGTSGGGQLSTGLATVLFPRGLAIDPAAGKLYWANFGGGGIGFAKLDGSGGDNLNIAPLTSATSGFPSLLEVPANIAAPAVSGGSTQRSTLACSQGSWAADLLGSHLYQRPRSFAYSWTLNGSPVAGAVSSSITATSPGSYVCQVTAANQAGSTQNSSAAHVVAADTHALTVTEHGTGSGTVSSSPGPIACGAVCSASYPATTTIALTATPASGSKFAGWAGACSATGACSVSMTADQAVTATFMLLAPNTKITKVTISSKQHKATFRFAAVGNRSGFRCALVKKPKRHHKHAKPSYRSCRSPKRYKHLNAGRYTFSVRASNAGGSDPTPATKRFTIR
jgi:DNA-binding beta-propeller fold protein YncE